jgi:hypothetical protein
MSGSSISSQDAQRRDAERASRCHDHRRRAKIEDSGYEVEFPLVPWHEFAQDVCPLESDAATMVKEAEELREKFKAEE